MRDVERSVCKEYGNKEKEYGTKEADNLGDTGALPARI